MPRFDGTGPRGAGAMTGRGEGYCAVAYPKGSRPYGYAGIQGRPIGGFGFMRRFSPLRRFGRGVRGGRRGRRARW
ncbi:MAG: DUF5320 domain-containing protein [Anaerolineae bacterium]